jgi:hypothetical protein
MWNLKPNGRMPNQWTCDKCQVNNILGFVPQWPDLPRTLYIGHEKNRQMKVHPFPPSTSSPDAWAQPYSIRSFVSQASAHFGGCHYWSSFKGEVMGEPTFTDQCAPHECADSWDYKNCHLVAGWTLGQITCSLWESIGNLCQTDAEKKFLHWYLGYAKDRQFPMLIPQARIGIAERRRPDFVLFVPLQYWNYKQYAVQLDKAHTSEMAQADDMRDAEVQLLGYEVIRLRPEKQGYFEEVRNLVERLELEMQDADTNTWSVALNIPVKKSVPIGDIPF